jgi:16S rRNA processing protein RimM
LLNKNDFGDYCAQRQVMETVTIAKIVRTRGLRGEVVAELFTDFPERFENTKDVFLVSPTGKTLEAKLDKFWFQKDRVILKFAGFDTIEKAEELRNFEVKVAEEDAVELAEDEFFDWQLEDCDVETLDGVKLGKVKELLRTGGTDVLLLSGGEKEYMIPFAGAICVEVDVENKLIKVDPPEGLLEF